jgi:Alkylmercury lyase
MLFFASSEHLQQWRDSRPDARGVELSIETVLKLSGPLYTGKMGEGFVRPSHDRMVQLFRELKLTGEFWRI